ncbi:MAG: DUF5615 family PIN-like protein [Ferruginibacter sp.]|nr:DUF5615 family PIN-like protein [Ferruginibacter sp.]
MILADENISSNIILSLRKRNFNVFSIKESARGNTDVSIADYSINAPRIILTEDKDFGYLAFEKKILMTGCILLRYLPFEEIKMINLLLLFLENHSLETLAGKFITITPNKIRITNI